jgi:hypothetical protein
MKHNKLQCGRFRTRAAAVFAVERLEHRMLLCSTWYVSPTGSDSNPGTQAQPFLTLQKAAFQVIADGNAHGDVAAGDTIIAEAGTYPHGLTLGWDNPTSGTATNPITIEADPAAPSGSVIISGNGYNSLDGIDLEAGCSYVTIKGFTINNASGTIGRAGIRIEQSTGVQVLNNVCNHDGTWGIFSSHTTDLLVQGNVASNAIKQHGIYISNSPVNTVLRDNIVFGNTMGVEFNADASQGGTGIGTGALIEDNVIYNNIDNGLNLDGLQNSVIRNNLIYGNTHNGISIYQLDSAEPGKNDLIENNTIYQPNSSGAALHFLDGSTGNTVFNNILIGGASGTYDNDSASMPGLVSDYNTVPAGANYNVDSNPSTLAQWQATGQDTHSIVASAAQIFTNFSSGDFHPITGSPTIDAGVGSLNGQAAPAVDMDGNARPQGNGFDVGAYEFVTTTLSGSIYSDVNDNGVRDAGEHGVPAVVTLHGVDGSGNPTSRTTTSDAVTGSYSFGDMAPGVYSVSVALPGGYLAGHLNGNELISGINIAANALATGNDFGIVPAASVGGFVYVDANDSGSRAAGAAGVGASLSLNGTDDLGHAVSLTTMSDGTSGAYNFGGLRPGVYSVSVSQPAGYFPDKQGISGSIANLIATAGAATSMANFGEIPPASLSGSVFADANGNGVRDAGEAGLDATVVLSGTNDLGQTVVMAANSNTASGAYRLGGLRPGTYSVTATPPAGWVSGANDPGTIQGIAISTGAAVISEDIGLVAAGSGGTPGGASSALRGAIAMRAVRTAVSNSPVNWPVTVTVTNNSSQTVTGPVTVSVYVSTDGAVDGASEQVAVVTVKNLRLKAGKSRKIGITLRRLPALADGSYRLVARIEAPNQTLSDAPAPISFTAAAPFVDLRPEMLVSSPLAKQGHGSAFVVVQNMGNVTAGGIVKLTITTADGKTTLGTATISMKLAAGAKRRIPVRLLIPASVTPGRYQLSATVDASGMGDATVSDKTVLGTGTLLVL